MSQWKHKGNPEQVVTISLDRRRFKTNKGIIDCPDALDPWMERCKQFERMTKKPTKTLRQPADPEGAKEPKKEINKDGRN